MHKKPLINKHNFNYIFQKCPDIFLNLVCTAIDFEEEVKDYYILTRPELCNEDKYIEGNLFLIINNEYIVEVSLLDENDDYDIEKDNKKTISFITSLSKDYDKYKYIKVNIDGRQNAKHEPVAIAYSFNAGIPNNDDYPTKNDIDIYINI